MAGWKLRKDKAQAESPVTTEDPSEDPSVPGWDTPAAETEETFLPATAEPTFEADTLDTEFKDTEFKDTEFKDTEFDDPEPHYLGGVIALGGEAEPLVIAPLPDFEQPDFEQPDFEPGDEITFDDDMEDDAPQGATIYAEPKAVAPPLAMPEEATPAFGASLAAPAPVEARDVPEVAPFVMDTAPAAPTADLPHRLVMRIGKLSAAFELVKEVTVIGRPDSDLHFYPDMEVEMDDAVSRRHAEVVKNSDGQFSLLDSGSTNGTRLNGELLPPNEERLLAPGDRIHIGERTEIIFE